MNFRYMPVGSFGEAGVSSSSRHRAPVFCPPHFPRPGAGCRRGGARCEARLHLSTRKPSTASRGIRNWSTDSTMLCSFYGMHGGASGEHATSYSHPYVKRNHCHTKFPSQFVPPCPNRSSGHRSRSSIGQICNCNDNSRTLTWRLIGTRLRKLMRY
ncbi:hypothetical protein LZ32DRAFT_161595 [Colletotrichum eremochloae]|nr:hypothetical protein LZ32DRAFT_161595 [Colletotrichum eremochloae]